MMSSTALGISKVFILDKYFTELQKFWDTEKRLQDAAVPEESAHLQQRLRHLSSGLVGIRRSLHESGPAGSGLAAGPVPGQPDAAPPVASTHESLSPPPPFQPIKSASCFSMSQQSLSLQPQHRADPFGTLRSVRSLVNDVSSANLDSNPSDRSDEAAAHNGLGKGEAGLSAPRPPPAQPISTLQQHDYTNLVQQPSPVLAAALSDSNLAVGTLSSHRPSGPNSLSGGSPFAHHFNLVDGPGRAFSRSAVRPRTPDEEATKTLGSGSRRRADKTALVSSTGTGNGCCGCASNVASAAGICSHGLLEEAKKAKWIGLTDLIHLEPPFSEEMVIRSLQVRFFNQKYFTYVGPIALFVNTYRDVGNALTLTSTRSAAMADNHCQLGRIVQDAVNLQAESGYPQAVIVSGISGSGKTYTSMVMLRQLFDVASGGASHETDTFKHLSAAFTVLRSLGTAKTSANRESSRIGHFIEVQVSDGALYRTKIHCYFLDQNRVVRPPPTEKSYHIFYQMLAGLSMAERAQLGLEGMTIRDLLYLSVGDTRQDEVLDAQRFADWKASLSVLGIPFADVVRILAAVLLLGNVEFAPRGGEEAYDIEVIGKEELNTVANLLGVPVSALWSGLTSRTHTVRGQLVKSMSDSNLCNATRNALAKALYCRTVATIVRRANSLKHPVGPLSGTMSSDSNESVQHEVASHHASTIGTAGSRKSSKSMAILNHAVRHATDGFIGILDMFGFEDGKPSRLEQLCINLCSETMQHFYNTHIFKSSIESCREEGIHCDMAIDYVDNVPCIDLISSLRTGLLSMLDVECSVRGFPETYVQKVKVQHKDNQKLYEPKHCDISRTFGIVHYAGQVVYDTSEFLDTNRDIIPDDIVTVFHRDLCQFGFATHLFGNEIKALAAMSRSAAASPRGVCFRISPTSNPENQLLYGDEPVSTLTQDFHTRLDNLLRTLVHAKPHFVRCIRPNEHDSLTEFDRFHVAQQVRSLQVLETVNLMAKGFPHRMRFKAFNARYRMLATPISRLSRLEDKAVDDCEAILDCYTQTLRQQGPAKANWPPDAAASNKDWAHGRKHIFLSEGARQQLERLRMHRRCQAAITIQAVWRGWHARLKMRATMPPAYLQPLVQRHPQMLIKPTRGESLTAQHGLAATVGSAATLQHRPRPQPITCTPPPNNPDPEFLHPVDRCDFTTIQQTCSLFGLDLERPPPVPPSRPYTVTGNKKITFPQTRVMTMSFQGEGDSNDLMLFKGETVIVIGQSTKRGHLVVEKHNHTIHVPHYCLQLRHPLTGMGI